MKDEANGNNINNNNKDLKKNNSKDNLNIIIQDNKILDNLTEIENKNFLELTIPEKIKFLAYIILGLALLRIFTLELFTMIGELLIAIIVYLYSFWKNKCMAIVVMINGVSGFIYSFIKLFILFFKAKSESFSYFSTIVFIVDIFSTFVYALILYAGYYGFRNFAIFKYKTDDQPSSSNYSEISRGHNQYADYGALENNENKNLLQNEKTGK